MFAFGINILSAVGRLLKMCSRCVFIEMEETVWNICAFRYNMRMKMQRRYYAIVQETGTRGAVAAAIRSELERREGTDCIKE